MDAVMDLPRSNARSGAVPDASPRFATVLVEEWAASRDADKPTALGTPFRHSDAAGCGRYLSYVAAGIPASDPMDLSGVWNTSLGTLIHEEWQAALAKRYPGAEIEVTCATVDADGSGHIDAVVRDPVDGTEFAPLRTIAIELKTVGGFAYKMAVGAKSKGTAAQGPKTAHLVQAALNALAVDADEAVVVYLAKECVSVNEANRFGLTELERFCAEWSFTREQFEPVARTEAARVSGILSLVEDGTLARRTVPFDMVPGAEIVDPAKGAWVEVDPATGDTRDSGTQWSCGYCSRQTLCAELPPGRIPVAEAREVAVRLGLTTPLVEVDGDEVSGDGTGEALPEIGPEAA